jgi:DNA mismatch repair protein MutS
MTAAISAAGALMGYLQETQKENLRFRKISLANQRTRMFLDAPTQRNLELIHNISDNSSEASLLWALDRTLTSMGGRFLRNSILSPLLDIEEINRRLDAVKYLTEDYELVEGLRNSLRKVQDVERLAQRIATGSANARDLVAVKNSLGHLPGIKAALCKALDGCLASTGEEISELFDLRMLIDKAIVDHPPHGLKDGGIIKAGFNGEADELRDISVNTKDYITALEAEEKKKTGISSLKVGYNKIHGYYIEVTRANLSHVPDRYTRKQTLVGGERYITPELKEYESKVMGAEDRLKALEYRIFLDLLEDIKGDATALMDTAEALALADFLVSLAVVAKRHNYIRPRMADNAAISITNGRHPVIERLPMFERFIPNDTFMDGGSRRLLMITGPNMAGKSTYMRQVALIALMAQIGSFVPADEATLGIVDRIFTRSGASDVLTKGQSTFMVEMVETANILNNATEKSLILLDEIGRGTSTFDGISIAWAAAEHITNFIAARTMFATHYIELTALAHTIEGVKNYNIAVKEWGDEIIFLRKIESGPADKSYGIHVARLAGLPDEVIAKAKEVLLKLEKQQIGEGMSHYRQMDLFAEKQDVLLEGLLALDLEALEPEQVVSRIRELKKKAQGK